MKKKKGGEIMAKKGTGLSTLLSFVMWLTGVIVALSVGFAMTGGTLSLPDWLGGAVVAIIAGWIVVISTLLSVIIAVVDYFS